MNIKKSVIIGNVVLDEITFAPHEDRGLSEAFRFPEQDSNLFLGLIDSRAFQFLVGQMKPIPLFNRKEHRDRTGERIFMFSVFLVVNPSTPTGPMDMPQE